MNDFVGFVKMNFLKGPLKKIQILQNFTKLKNSL